MTAKTLLTAPLCLDRSEAESPVFKHVRNKQEYPVSTARGESTE